MARTAGASVIRIVNKISHLSSVTVSSKPAVTQNFSATLHSSSGTDNRLALRGMNGGNIEAFVVLKVTLGRLVCVEEAAWHRDL